MKSVRAQLELLLAVVLLLALFGQMVTGSLRLSLTTDEPMHIAMGYADLLGDYGLLPAHIHPPLVNAWAAWPLLLRPGRPELSQVPGWEQGNLFQFSAQLLLRLGPVEAVELATRVPIMLLSLLLGALVYRWAADLFGARAGLVALFLYVFDPGIVSNSQLNTTDIGALAFGLLAVYAGWRAVRRPTARLTVLMGLALGMSMAAKVSGLFFVPMLAAPVGVALLRAEWGRWSTFGKQALRWGVRLVLVYMLAFGVLWAAYRFEFRPMPGTDWPVPATSHWLVLRAFDQHVQEGHLAFAAGQIGQHGWWWYFPLAFVVKTPVPTLLLLALAIIGWARRPRTGWIDAVWLLAIPVVYFFSAVFSTIDIGYRHLLPMFPFLFIFIARLARQGAPRVMRVALGGLMAWGLIEAVLIYPHALAYFNQLAGGADNGYRYLVDSNTDWGQTLKELRRYIKARGTSTVNLSQFTFIDPAIYGLLYQPLAPMKGAPPVLPARFNPPPGVYAISTTSLQGIPLADPEQFDWFRRQESAAKVAHVMFVYDVPQPATPGTWVAECTAPVTPLEPEQIAEGLGRDDLRLAYFDCAQSWLYPEGGAAPGWLILARDAPAWTAKYLASARLSYEQARGGFSPPFRIYTRDGRPTYPMGGRVHVAPSESPLSEALSTPLIDLPVTLEGGLTLIGYALSQPAIKAGETLYLETTWRVDGVPGRLLSVMAHVVGDDGRVMAVGDGLGVPIESWRTGDVFVQRHALTWPEGAPPGSYWIQSGAYWLDNGERWPARDERATGNRILLTALEARPR
jgi:4-amino-4-deoxy-L-arabinose transferase-like glycosyltransferase